MISRKEFKTSYYSIVKPITLNLVLLRFSRNISTSFPKYKESYVMLTDETVLPFNVLDKRIKILKLNSENLDFNTDTKFKNNNPGLKQSFLFTFILNSLNFNIPEDASQMVQYSFSIFLLSLVCLFNFISVVGYLTAIYLVNKYDIETKFPKFKRIIRYYEKSSLFFVVFEGLMCVILLLIIIVSSLYFAGAPIFKN